MLDFAALLNISGRKLLKVQTIEMRYSPVQ